MPDFFALRKCILPCHTVAKDFFLQGINEHFHLGIPSKEVSEDKLMICGSIPFHARNVVGYIKGLLSKEKSWLWRLNNYRNEATHREILHFYNVMEGPTLEVRQGEESQLQIVLDPETKAPKYLRRVDITSEDHEFKYVGTYLFKCPEDPSQGHLDIKVADYCEQGLNRMKKFLVGLYSQLRIQIN